MINKKIFIYRFILIKKKKIEKRKRKEDIK